MKDEIRQIAYEYYLKHRRKITNEMNTVENELKPRKEDERQPMLWKPAHWLYWYNH